MEEINASIGFDQRLFAQDIRGSLAHAQMLVKQGIISAADGKAIADGLSQIEAEIKDGTFTFSRALEDIHMNIEARLGELIGAAAGRLHTARSRNDQVATDFRLYVRDALDHMGAQIHGLMGILLNQAEAHAETSCRALPICNRRSRSLSAIIFWLMSKCWRAMPAVLPMHGRG